MKHKKGIQLNQAFGAVLTLVLVAVLVIIAIFIFVSLSTSFAGSESITTVNENITMTTGTGTTANSTLCEYNNFAVTSVQNGTSALLGAGNYTTTAAGTILNTSENGSPWTVNHTGTWGGAACKASDDMNVEFGNYTSLIGLVGTIIFLGLVIGILVAAFAFGGRKEV